MTASAQQTPVSVAAEYPALAFIVQQLLSKVQTASVVKVLAVQPGAVGPVGYVTVQILVNQMTGDRTAVPHGSIPNIPYFRLQGGTNAVIIDPQVGDLGICLFCSRDIANVKATKAQANPSTFRMFDFNDGLYVGGILNGTPQQYVQFAAGGITIVSPQQITLQAPTVNIQGSSAVNIGSPATALTGGNTSIDGKAFLPHKHSGVQPGSGQSGGVV
jgi:hypothetical protein